MYVCTYMYIYNINCIFPEWLLPSHKLPFHSGSCFLCAGLFFSYFIFLCLCVWGCAWVNGSIHGVQRRTLEPRGQEGDTVVNPWHERWEAHLGVQRELPALKHGAIQPSSPLRAVFKLCSSSHLPVFILLPKPLLSQPSNNAQAVVLVFFPYVFLPGVLGAMSF